MRKTWIILLLLIGFSNPILAQVDLSDLLEGKLVIAEPSFDIIEEAINPALGITRQQYRLERDGESYGRNNMPYYGENYTLSVKVAGGTLFPKGVVCPWLYDTNYAKVNQSKKYTPVQYATKYRSLSDSIYKNMDLELGSRYTQLVDKDSLLYMHLDSYPDFGLAVDNTEGEKRGYMIWVYSTTNLQDSAMVAELKQSSLNIQASADSTKLMMKPENPNKVLGGVYVVPVVERLGYIQIRIVGMASKDTDSAWYLNLLTVKSENPQEVNRNKPKKEVKKQGIEVVDELTPIKKKK